MATASNAPHNSQVTMTVDYATTAVMRRGAVIECKMRLYWVDGVSAKLNLKIHQFKSICRKCTGIVICGWQEVNDIQRVKINDIYRDISI